MGVEVGWVVQCIGVVYEWNMELLQWKNKDVPYTDLQIMAF
jgi:hypothetical protein